MPDGFVPVGDGSDRLTVDRLALIGRWSENFGLDLRSSIEAALATQEADHVAHLVAVAAHEALCWVQPDDGRGVACDRAREHCGAHSWEMVPADEVRARLRGREIQTRVDVAEEIAKAIRAVRDGSKAANYIAALDRSERLALARRVPQSEYVEEGAVAVEPKKLDTVISCRLGSDLAATLRDVANVRGCAVSDLLREGAELVVRDHHANVGERQ